MRVPRVLAVLLPVVLLTPLAGVVATASAAETTVISIKGQPRVGIFHDQIGPKTGDVYRHKGTLTTAGGDPVDGATVYLERMLTGDEDWVRFSGADVVTNANGVYVFFTFVEGNGKYRVVYEGDGVYSPVTSEIVQQKAMRDFNAQLVEKLKSAGLKGNINPGWDNQDVSWQKKTCKTCKWKSIATEKSGDNGSWSFSGDYPPLRKKWYYRAVIDGTADFVKSYSATLITTSTVARTVR